MKKYNEEELGPKKSKHSKFVAIFSIALTLIFGVGAVVIAFALSSSKISGSGNISFEAKNVIATVNGSLKINGTDSGHTFDEIKFDENTPTTDEEVSRDQWQNIPFTFGEASDVITFTITIQNQNTEYPMYVKFTDVVGDTSNINFSYQVGSNTATTTVPDMFTIAKETTETITITMSVINESKSINSAYSFTLQLSRTSID